MAFDPKYFADALEIGATLRLLDGLNPGMTTDPPGNFCLIMNQRVVPGAAIDNVASPAPAIAA